VDKKIASDFQFVKPLDIFYKKNHNKVLEFKFW
jgi:hypothetical protein